jgi:GntR family transcriptional regulator, rspAB operon transcriptional repressor
MPRDPVCGSLAERAYLLIRRKILSGELPLGAPLSRRKLAADFEMSFLPVSEAVKRLESEGLVESRPRVGTRVRIPTPQDIRDCYIIREALETQSARLFCERAAPAERKEIRGMVERLEAMTQAPESEAANPEFQFSVQSAHAALHMRIAECTRCQPLFDLIEKNHLLTSNWFFDISAGCRLCPGTHRALLDALNGNDADAAVLAMGAHIRAGLDEIQDSIVRRFEGAFSDLRRVSAAGQQEAPAADGSWRRRYQTPS